MKNLNLICSLFIFGIFSFTSYTQTISGPSISIPSQTISYTCSDWDEAFAWSVEGGTIIGSTTSPTVQVKWGGEVGTGSVLVYVNVSGGPDITSKQVEIGYPGISISCDDNPAWDKANWYCCYNWSDEFTWCVDGGRIVSASSDYYYIAVFWDGLVGEVSIMVNVSGGPVLARETVYVDWSSHPVGHP